ncbi:type III secretion system inner rod subunit SctI [Providencia rettgeri]|uniref:Type III secretion system inner rod subunit SctI n=1 Tax=Providencia rettgeri TaxID=587 RepID=A0AAJ4NJS0_PRORE|nr:MULTISPECIES: type III secretion system inner rod subunit SctI [Providencia]MDB9567977.1 type III secretion system inner rod subunit SctI [Providencia rettgeri]QWQ17123.1 type III secretion system inner rod subunit SctI [Providencia rettgeri]QWQ20958.1 type III secretion system inner rod subunit SctI [Providencia rettgeri]QWQ24794.1 type III secretion system inner rod subunit SctI [Providencia rettgeri]WOB91152.1 type III secretion system inner rod subunit SctI [Providencia sp. PROV175]
MLAITPHLLLTAPTETTSVLPSSIPIEDKVKKLFAEYTAAVSQERKALTENVNNIDPSNPTQLLQFQNRVGNYSLTMNMISTLTHKSVSAIDTVLKAQ